MSDCDIPNKCSFCGEHVWCENSRIFQRLPQTAVHGYEAGYKAAKDDIANMVESFSGVHEWWSGEGIKRMAEVIRQLK